jgi:Zn-dependent alcohol dehydrogenase
MGFHPVFANQSTQRPHPAEGYGAEQEAFLAGSRQITAAVVRRRGGPFRIETLRLSPPRADEALVRIVATGMCHTDLLVRDDPGPGPIVLGHEGAGVVERAGRQARSRHRQRSRRRAKRILGIIEGDSVPELFIPQLIELYRQGRFPFDRLIRFYRLDQINQAAKDSEAGVTIKPVLRVTSARASDRPPSRRRR